MRAIQIALAIMLFHAALGLLVASGLYNVTYYENLIITTNLPQKVSGVNEWEQLQASYDSMSDAIDKLTWGWIKDYFEPAYSQHEDVKKFVDHLIDFARYITGFIIGVAIIEFVRNRMYILGA